MRISTWFCLSVLILLFTGTSVLGQNTDIGPGLENSSDVVLEGKLTMAVVLGEESSPVLVAKDKIYKVELPKNNITIRMEQYYQVKGTFDEKKSMIYIVELKQIDEPDTLVSDPDVVNTDTAKVLGKTEAIQSSIQNTKKDDKLIEKYTKEIELNPEDGNAYYQRGSILLYHKEYKRAVEDFTKAIETKPDYAEAFTRRGNAYKRLNENEKACADFEKACELGSCKWYDNAQKEGWCLKKKKKTETAIVQAPVIKKTPPVKKAPATKKVSATKKVPERYVSPLEKISLEQIRVVAIINMPGGFKAIVEDTETGKGYMVKKGSMIGVNSGRIKDITDKKIIVEEKHKSEQGWVENRMIELEP